MSELVRMHCLHCKQTFFTGPDAKQCDVCLMVGGMVPPDQALEQSHRAHAWRPQQATRPPGGYPTSARCPTCGGGAFTRVRPDRWVSYAWDRVCKQCDTRYTPPTPLWAAIVMLFAGLILLGIGGVGAFFALLTGNLLEVVCVALLGVLGVLAMAHAILSFVRLSALAPPPSPDGEGEGTKTP